MGRILKKKDPSKKKAQRIAANDNSGAVALKNGGGATVNKPAPFIRKATGADKPKAVSKEPNFLQKSAQFLREVKIELKKVTWPTRQQTIGSTAVVLILVIIISLFLGLVDLGLSSLIRFVLP
jgi:preprotein translocase subunit SecE